MIARLKWGREDWVCKQVFMPFKADVVTLFGLFLESPNSLCSKMLHMCLRGYRVKWDGIWISIKIWCNIVWGIVTKGISLLVSNGDLVYKLRRANVPNSKPLQRRQYDSWITEKTIGLVLAVLQPCMDLSIATGVTCKQRTLTSPDTESCPFWDLHVFLCETNLSWTCLVSGLLSFEHTVYVGTSVLPLTNKRWELHDWSCTNLCRGDKVTSFFPSDC